MSEPETIMEPESPDESQHSEEELIATDSESEDEVTTHQHEEDHSVAPILSEKQPLAGGLFSADYSDFPLEPFQGTEDPNYPEIDELGNTGKLTRDDAWLQDCRKPFEPSTKQRRIETETEWTLTSHIAQDEIPFEITKYMLPHERPAETICRLVKEARTEDFNTFTELTQRSGQDDILHQLPFHLNHDFTVLISVVGDTQGPFSMKEVSKLHLEGHFTGKKVLCKTLFGEDTWVPIQKLLKKLGHKLK
ncbi:hypothetical protein P9112_012306 [Eukaryota sp. TZLM1-RC]